MNRVLIFANGEEVSTATIAQVYGADDIVICADGGVSHLEKHSLLPRVVVGDFDSLSKEELEQLKSQKIEVRRYSSDKDQTDLELALDLASEYQPSEIVIIDALGGRVDHLLGNIMLLTSLERYSCPISIVGDSVFITAVSPDRALRREGKIGEIFSLIPISKSVEGVSLTGAKWPLKNATLNRGRALTISNSFAETQVDVSVSKGIMLFVVDGSR